MISVNSIFLRRGQMRNMTILNVKCVYSREKLSYCADPVSRRQENLSTSFKHTRFKEFCWKNYLPALNASFKLRGIFQYLRSILPVYRRSKLYTLWENVVLLNSLSNCRFLFSRFHVHVEIPWHEMHWFSSSMSKTITDHTKNTDNCK